MSVETRFSRTASFLALVALVLAFQTPRAAAQQGTITGRVVDAETGAALSGAAIEVLGQSALVEAGESGRFTVSVPAGSHSLVAALIGYETARVDGVDVAAGGTADVELSLRSQALVLNPVVVTASRRQEKALDAPASVSAVSADEIARTIKTTPAEHVRSLPGIDMAQTGLTQTNIVARGFNNVFSGALLTIMDNRYARIPSLRFNAHNMLPATDLDIERIEVSLGPGAALYGPNASTGVMHLITSSPIDKPGTTLSLAGGERSVFHGQFRTAHALSSGFGFKLSGQYFRGNDFEYIDPVEERDPPDLERDFLNERYSADARLDFRFAGDAELIVSGGMNVAAKSIELTGIGAAQAQDWGYQYAQTRFSKGRLFAQAFLNQTNAGDATRLLRTGVPVVDKSRALAVQFQYGFDLGSFQSFTYGVDWQRTEPRTGGTITGGNEEDDLVSEIGAYVHSETALGDKVDLVAAVRVDDHSRLAGAAISPRAALVLKPAEDQTFRLTFNRAFATPTTNNLFLDILAGGFELGFGLPGYGIRALGVPAGGFTWDNQCPGGFMSMCMYSPFMPGQLPANAALFWDAMMQRLPEFDASLGALVPVLVGPGQLPGDPVLATVFRRLNQAAAETGQGDLFPLDATGLTSIAEMRSTIYNTFEAGYKGVIGDRVLLAADVYHARVKDFVGPLRIETPNVFLDAESVQQFLAARLGRLVQAGQLDPAGVAGIIAAITPIVAAIPFGTVVPDQVDSPDLLVTYRNFGDVNYWGTDLAMQVLASDRVRINGAYSFQSDECFDFNEDGRCTSADDIALNAPRHKGSVGFVFDDQAAGWSFDGRFRMSGGFPMNSGVYIGDVESYGVVDLGVGWRLPFQPSARVSLNASNVLDNKHREFVGAPELGRLILARVRYDF